MERRLGRGLGSLLGDAQPEEEEREIALNRISPNPHQPREVFDASALEELRDSIRNHGVLQPIALRAVGERYEIIAGERRWRATQLAGLDSIPALVREVPDNAAIAMSLIENIQREDLNPIEEAAALMRLQQEFELTQQEVADAVGKSRSTVANLLRLMTLQEDVRRLVEHGDLEMGHARALLGLVGAQQSHAARTVVGRGLSVRQTEALVRGLLERREKPAPEHKTDPNIRHLQDDLSQRLGTRVEIKHGAGGKGKLVMSYNSLDELDGILSHIK